MFPQGATPAFVLTIPSDLDLTLASSVVASFRCSGVQYNITVPAADVTATTATVRLTQEQTLAWEYGSTLKVQLNVLLQDSTRVATSVWEGIIDEQLLTEVMS